MKYFCFIVIFGFISGMSMLAGNQHADADSGTWTHVRRQTPQEWIETIFPGSDGRVWATTSRKFHVFNGTTWKLYTHDREVLSNHVPFMRDKEDRLYIIDDDDLVIWEADTIERYDSTDSTLIRRPVVAAFSDDGVLYMGSASFSTSGIYTFNGNTVSKISDYRTKSLTFDAEGRLWATYHDPDTSKKNMYLAVMENGKWIDKTEEIDFLYPEMNKALTVQTAPDSSVWVNNLDKYGIYRNGEWSFHSGGNYTVPVFLKFDKSGRVWGYGSNKLYKLDSTGKWELMREFNFGPSDRKYFLAETPDSTLWISDTSDVYYYVDNQWVIVDTPHDLASDIVTCFIYTLNGDLICGHGLRGLDNVESENSGVSIRSGGMWNNYNKYEDIFLYNVYQFERMPSGEIMAYSDLGLKIYDEIDNSWTDIDSLIIITIQTDMAWDNNDKMWITTEIGLFKYSDAGYEIKIPFEKEKFIIVDNLTINYDDILFMQQRPEGYIISYDDYDESWEIVIADDGMTNDFTIAEDGTIWGARVNSLSYWNNNLTKWTSVVTLDNGKFVHIDETGRIWASGYGNTGYYENGTWYRIQELTDFTSDYIAMNGEGNVVLNVFDSERKYFYGFFEYLSNTGLRHTDKAPVSFITAGNYPNPFNPFTTIYFELPSSEMVTITVFSVTGQRVKKLSNKRFPAGLNNVVWDAKSDYGNPCASGVYFYRIKAGVVVKTGKMLLMR